MKGATPGEFLLRSSNVLGAHVIADISDIRWQRAQDFRRAATQVEDSHAREWPHMITYGIDAHLVGAHQTLHGAIDERMRKYRADAGGDLCHVSEASLVVHP